MTAVRIVKIEDIEDAFLARLGDPRITDSSKRDPSIQANGNDVPIFLDMPSTKIYKDRLYPAISVNFLSLNHAIEREHSEDEEELSFNNTVDPPERTMIDAGIPRDISYMIDTWAMNRAADDRSLIQDVQNRLRARSALWLDKGEVTTFALPMFQAMSMQKFDESVGDEQIYHKRFTYVVEFLMYDDSPEAQTVEKTAVHFFYNVTELGKQTVAPDDAFVYHADTDTTETL